MPLEAIGPMMRAAVEGGYAVGYFESWNLESLQGVVDAAEETRFAGDSRFQRRFPERRRAARPNDWHCTRRLGRAAAESSSVPCGLIFNECPRDDWVVAAMTAGFNLVMLADPDAATCGLSERVADTHAHGPRPRASPSRRRSASCPAGRSDGGDPRGGYATDPAAAAEFVAATGVDLLAVSVGNVHIRTAGEQGLDLALLEQIHRRVPVPLVLHGGTGIAPTPCARPSRWAWPRSIIGTYLKRRYLKAVRAALGRDCPDPHRLLGMGGPEDVLVAGRLAVRDAVLERIDLLGCRGKASSDQ